jgi:hypothetical protein
VAMGSPLSPIITNFDKEDYEGRRLNRPHWNNTAGFCM